MKLDEEDGQAIRVAKAAAADAESIRRLVLSHTSPDRDTVLMRILDGLERLGRAVELPQLEVANLLGCEDPEPESWLTAEISMLRKSALVVELLSELAVAASSAEERAANPVSAAREIVLIGVEAITKAGGDTRVARWVVSRGPASTLDLVKLNRMGTARLQMRQSLRAWKQNPIDEQYIADFRRSLDTTELQSLSALLSELSQVTADSDGRNGGEV